MLALREDASFWRDIGRVRGRGMRRGMGVVAMRRRVAECVTEEQLEFYRVQAVAEEGESYLNFVRDVPVLEEEAGNGTGSEDGGNGGRAETRRGGRREGGGGSQESGGSDYVGSDYEAAEKGRGKRGKGAAERDPEKPTEKPTEKPSTRAEPAKKTAKEEEKEKRAEKKLLKTLNASKKATSKRLNNPPVKDLPTLKSYLLLPGSTHGPADCLWADSFAFQVVADWLRVEVLVVDMARGGDENP